VQEAVLAVDHPAEGLHVSQPTPETARCEGASADRRGPPGADLGAHGRPAGAPPQGRRTRGGHGLRDRTSPRGPGKPLAARRCPVPGGAAGRMAWITPGRS
jgi:hypothetical protein